MNPTKSLVVTTEECKERHKRLWLAVKVGGGMLGLMLTLIGIFSTMAYRASAKSAEAQEEITKVQTEVSTAFPFIKKGIDRIEKRLDDLAREKHGQ